MLRVGGVVAAALEGLYLLRRRAGGEPFAGAVLATHVAAAGFVDAVTSRVGRDDMTYGDLGRYVGSRLHVALGNDDLARDPAERNCLERAAAADRWSGRRGRFVQSWVEVTARRPGDSSQNGGGSSSRRAARAGRGAGTVAGR